jgi:hypothetical protein
MNKFNINPSNNYERIDNSDVFTGQQLLNLLEIASPDMQAVILLGCMPTDKPPTHPGTKYGPAEA